MMELILLSHFCGVVSLELFIRSHIFASYRLLKFHLFIFASYVEQNQSKIQRSASVTSPFYGVTSKEAFLWGVFFGLVHGLFCFILFYFNQSIHFFYMFLFKQAQSKTESWLWKFVIFITSFLKSRF